MNINTIVKGAAIIQTTCVVAMIGIVSYCAKKQKEIDVITADHDRKLAATARQMTGLLNIAANH
jgi:hypothetical protein